MRYFEQEITTEKTSGEALPTPMAARRSADRLAGIREQLLLDHKSKNEELDACSAYLQISGKVTAALELLSQKLFQSVLSVIEESLTIALQEVLEQPVQLKTAADWQRGSATVEFWIERDGHPEDIMKGQGGSVINVLSVGLRMFALTTLDESIHRRFLVLDEQDCWIRPTLVPRLVKVVHAAGKTLGFQVIMISHHDTSTFEYYADRIYEFRPIGNNDVEVKQIYRGPLQEDQDHP
jgi:hypothetical protein